MWLPLAEGETPCRRTHGAGWACLCLYACRVPSDARNLMLCPIHVVRHYAVAGGAANTIALFGARADLVMTQKDDAGRTPLHWACQKANGNVIKVLLDVARKCDQMDAVLAEPDNNQWLPLHYAAHVGDVDCLQVVYYTLGLGLISTVFFGSSATMRPAGCPIDALSDSRSCTLPLSVHCPRLLAHFLLFFFLTSLSWASATRSEPGSTSATATIKPP